MIGAIASRHAGGSRPCATSAMLAEGTPGLIHAPDPRLPRHGATSLTSVLAASVVVPTYNRPAALARTLAALRAMTFPANQLEIVVVDSGAAGNGGEAVAIEN